MDAGRLRTSRIQNANRKPNNWDDTANKDTENKDTANKDTGVCIFFFRETFFSVRVPRLLRNRLLEERFGIMQL